MVWELGEYVAFVRHSPELQTAYTDTLGDLTLGTLGALLAGLTLEIYLSLTGWLYWLEDQNYPFGHAVLLLLALAPLVVFAWITRWLSRRLTAGVSRLLHPDAGLMDHNRTA